MSYIYAEIAKYEFDNQILKTINIYSDTKITMNDIVKKKFNAEDLIAIEQFGIIKNINISNNLNLSFAGNNLKFAIELLDFIYQNSKIKIEQIINKALEIHKKAENNEIEFILCEIDNEQNPHIFCIKDGYVENNCLFAFIGSNIVRQEFLKLRNEAKKNNKNISTLNCLLEIINNSKDDTVGQFIIYSGYSLFKKSFLYKSFLYSVIERKKNCKKGDFIPLFDTKENGGFCVIQQEDFFEVKLIFNEINLCVCYTPNHNYLNFKHLLLPKKVNY